MTDSNAPIIKKIIELGALFNGSVYGLGLLQYLLNPQYPLDILHLSFRPITEGRDRMTRALELQFDSCRVIEQSATQTVIVLDRDLRVYLTQAPHASVNLEYLYLQCDKRSSTLTVLDYRHPDYQNVILEIITDYHARRFRPIPLTIAENTDKSYREKLVDTIRLCEQLGFTNVSRLDLPTYQQALDDGLAPYLERSCSICQENFTTNELVYITACSHLFHPQCIEDSYRTNPECPNCRTLYSLYEFPS